ncbi:MAG: nitrous oxide reductase family maturation protein NosD, partial [Bacteroidetes bacterium HGW-Bacteroidetes-23]
MRLLFLLLLCISSLQAQKLEVGINKPYKTIKQALKASKVGDTVLVYKGIYKEGNLRIDKKIVFLGKDFPVLDGQKKVEVLSIHADSVIVKGFRVINSGFGALEDPCGIKVYNKSFVVIEGNQLD